MLTINSSRIALAALLFGASLLGLPSRESWSEEGTPKAQETEKRRVFNIVVAGQPFTGYLNPPATETGFEFEMKDTSEKINFRWSQLPESERKRVRKHFGLPEEEGGEKANWGGDVQAVRFHLKSGKSIEGIERPERATSGNRCLQSSRMFLQVPTQDIESVEHIKKKESDLLRPEDVYERMLLENPPGESNSNDHIRLARQLLEMTLYEKALDHLSMAVAIDARVEERTKDLRATIEEKLQDKHGQELYNGILADMARGDYAEALEKLDRFARTLPGHELLSKLEPRRAEIEKNKEENFRKYVATLFYTLSAELIREKLRTRIKIDEKGRMIPPIPGKQISTRNGKVYRGPLVEETAEAVTLGQNGQQIVILRNEITLIRDLDLSQGYKSISPSFAVLQSYVGTDAKGGLGGDIIARIAATLKTDEARVQEAWNSRAENNTIVGSSGVTKTPSFARAHDAYYGEGSWLREGAGGSGKDLKTRNTVKPQSNRNKYGKDIGASNIIIPDDTDARAREAAQHSDDPDVWWSVQSEEVKFRILRAIAGERIFRVKGISGRDCPSCSGKGRLEKIAMDGSRSYTTCPTCRGQKKLINVSYE